MGRLTQKLYIGLGSSGAMVEVSDKVDFAVGFARSWGRDTEFEDTNPGEFSFTLDNGDGRFTPENTAAALAAGFSTTLTEGMSVCHELGGTRLVHGTVQAIQPAFPGDEAAWSQVVVTCDDMLGDAARTDLSNDGLVVSLVTAADPYLYWPLTDASGSFRAEPAQGSVQYPPPLTVASGVATFGVPPVPNVEGTQVALGDAVFTSLQAGSDAFNGALLPSIVYETNSLGWFSLWYTIDNRGSGSGYPLQVFYTGSLGAWMQLEAIGNGVLRLRTKSHTTGTPTNTDSPAGLIGSDPVFYEVEQTTSFAAGVWTVTCNVYVNGVFTLTAAYTTVSQRISLISIYAPPSGGTRASHLSHTRLRVNAHTADGNTEAELLTALASAAPSVTLDTLPAGLASAPLGLSDDSGSVLDGMNAVVRTEQGHIYTTTTGTLLAPVEKINVRDRDRPTTVTATFDAEDEGIGSPDFIRDLTNLAQTVTANGPTDSATYSDPALSSRAGGKTVSEDVLLRDRGDLWVWSTDRSLRGANTSLRVASITIDAMLTPTDRSSDLLALVPGNRYQFTGLPTTQLGFSTWDGWLLGVEELHTISEHTFTLKLAPVLPETAQYSDGKRYMAGGQLSLSSDINNSTTTMSITSGDGITKFTTNGANLPLYVQYGGTGEIIQITACTSATPQVATIVRGALGSAATSHTAGDLLDLYTPSLYGF